MIRSGMTVARLNFSHGTHDDKRRMVERVRRAAEEEGRFVALMGDLQGPKIRVGELPKDGLVLKEGTEVTLTSAPVSNPEREIPFPHPEIVSDIHLGSRILMDDGSLELEALEIDPPRVRCRVHVGGTLTSNKGVNLPDVDLQISALTEKDREDACLALELGVDYLALSFVRSARDVEELREFLDKEINAPQHRRPGENPHRLPSLVAKIEKPEALQDLERIIHVSNGVMVARGDLGVETAPERVPLAQKHIIRLCNEMGRPVITATQMLQSMIENPRPTRAEASDVANAILDGSDAIMLSGETSIGKYPVHAVQMMNKIATTVEQSENFPYNQLLEVTPTTGKEEDQYSTRHLISRAIGRGTVKIAEECNATAILTSTESGRTARLVARHRPDCPLIAATPFKETARRLQMLWGVVAVLVDPFKNTDHMIQSLVQAAVEREFAEEGSNVVLTAGIPFEVHGVTNMLKVHTVREQDLAEE
jgi:pyruvate kinase